MLTTEERDRLEELTRTMGERPLDAAESAELGTLMAVDLGASREVHEPPQLRRRGPAPGQRKAKSRRRRF